MPIVLIDPPDISQAYGKISKKVRPFAPSLGIGYIAATLEKENVEVKLIDARGPGLTIQEIINKTISYSPDIVGISSMTTTFGASVEIANGLKTKSKNIKIVMGGPHITPTVEETLQKYQSIDIAAFGEGEYTMLELTQGKDLDKIKGIAYRENGAICKNDKRETIQDLDSLPFPARHLFDLKYYGQPVHESYGAPITTVLTGRGCPFNCSFCSSKVTFGRKVRFRSIQSVMEEIDHLIDNYHIKGIKFADDTFSLKKDRVERLCSELKKRKIYWIGNCRVETLTKDIMVLMKESNCKLLQFGIESGEENVLRQLKNTCNLNQVRKVFKWAHELKLDTSASFIFGSPLETPETAEKTIEFVKEIKPTFANFFVLSPYPGTEIYEFMRKNNMMKISDWTQVTSPKYEDFIIKHPNFSEEQLKKILRKAYKKYYYNWRTVIALLKRIDSLTKLKNYVKMASVASSFIKNK